MNVRVLKIRPVLVAARRGNEILVTIQQHKDCEDIYFIMCTNCRGNVFKRRVDQNQFI